MRNLLGLVYHWLCTAVEVSVYIRACTIFAFQSGKEEKLPIANFQLKNLQWSFANEYWTQAETKSDSRVGILMNVSEFKATFMDKLYYYYT